MLLGIKYIIGSNEQKAAYKKSMLPYLIGSIMLFSAVNLTSFLYNNIALDTDAVAAAKAYASSHNETEIREELDRIKTIILEMKKTPGEKDEKQLEYWENYRTQLNSSLKK